MRKTIENKRCPFCRKPIDYVFLDQPGNQYCPECHECLKRKETKKGERDAGDE